MPREESSKADANRSEFDAITKALNDHAIITLDVEGRIAAWGDGAHELTGYASPEAVGQEVSLLYTDEDRESGLIGQELAAARSGGRTELEGWRVRSDGRRFWASVVVAPIQGPAGEVAGFVKVVRDVTARRTADTMFQGLLESAPDAMVIVGPDGRIQLVNRQTEELFGYDRGELIGEKVEKLLPQRLHERHTRHRDGYFTAPKVRQMGAGLDLLAMRRDGSEFPVEISLSPLESGEGQLACAAIRDVTERRVQERRLRQQRDEILELSTPVIQVWDKVIALPIIGTLDSVRAARLTERLLEKIAELGAEVVILDISGVPTIDTLVAQHLLKTVQAATLMGAVSIMSGVRPETAQSIVHLGIDLGQLRSRTTLRDALQLALRIVRERDGDEAETQRIVAEELR
jgi:PAS domain S-box-containing protein